MKLEALWEILTTRLVRRNVPVKNLKRGDVEPASAGSVRQVITLQVGVPTEAAKDIVKYLKDAKLKKVQAAIMGDHLRVSSGSKDDLQGAMTALRAHDFGIALQFGNYR
jgi:cyclic-di-GMP-binding protein